MSYTYSSIDLSIFSKLEIQKVDNDINQTLTNNNSTSEIAIVVPFYNHIDYLDFTIRSLIDQTFTDYNVIIVDDASSDWGIKKKLKKLFYDYNNYLNLTIIFNNNNYGLPKCRNIAIEYTNSNWILPLDADDILDERFLEKAFNQIHSIKDTSQYPNIIVTSNVYRFNNDKEDDKIGYINKVGTWKIPKWDSNKLTQNNLLHCSTMFKKSLWSAIGGYDTSLWFGWEDWDFWIRADHYFKNNKLIIRHDNNTINNKIMVNGLNPIIIDEYLFYYRVKKEGLHSFCKVNFKLCYSLFQTLHPYIFSIEDILISHKYIGRNGDVLKNSLATQIKKYPNNPVNYFWLSLIKQYGNNNKNYNNNNPNKNIYEIKELYTKSINLEKSNQINNRNNQYDIINNSLMWQFELHRLLNELETIHYIQAKKDLLLFFKRYNSLNLNNKINRLYHLNI
ncbi:hypothetical protein DICPUDRAFT_73885 [Dictyostelium purpureum]|uniref:Glycosyltransferase 2-like domain-containing protein n=1 Tax=Dictyostelium purpureum TaxID=5786 RepID=F0Z655_DICPU|nr:uncharacterized protein DICPUDRAFT_73885 [Dictyostelium purpureum]EGC40596.1 hypothetical protein DICPUDRAFT_73885 [Dictyostelium purpureum]|eukprot:XP_003282932.1 hypothetical protein DICPUDRAFT_73885 [Dictyostelium purpureum]